MLAPGSSAKASPSAVTQKEHVKPGPSRRVKMVRIVYQQARHALKNVKQKPTMKSVVQTVGSQSKRVSQAEWFVAETSRLRRRKMLRERMCRIGRDRLEEKALRFWKNLQIDLFAARNELLAMVAEDDDDDADQKADLKYSAAALEEVAATAERCRHISHKLLSALHGKLENMAQLMATLNDAEKVTESLEAQVGELCDLEDWEPLKNLWQQQAEIKIVVLQETLFKVREQRLAIELASPKAAPKTSDPLKTADAAGDAHGRQSSGEAADDLRQTADNAHNEDEMSRRSHEPSSGVPNVPLDDDSPGHPEKLGTEARPPNIDLTALDDDLAAKEASAEEMLTFLEGLREGDDWERQPRYEDFKNVVVGVLTAAHLDTDCDDGSWGFCRSHTTPKAQSTPQLAGEVAAEADSSSSSDDLTDIPSNSGEGHVEWGGSKPSGSSDNGVDANPSELDKPSVEERGCIMEEPVHANGARACEVDAFSPVIPEQGIGAPVHADPTPSRRSMWLRLRGLWKAASAFRNGRALARTDPVMPMESSATEPADAKASVVPKASVELVASTPAAEPVQTPAVEPVDVAQELESRPQTKGSAHAGEWVKMPDKAEARPMSQPGREHASKGQGQSSPARPSSSSATAARMGRRRSAPEPEPVAHTYKADTGGLQISRATPPSRETPIGIGNASSQGRRASTGDMHEIAPDAPRDRRAPTPALAMGRPPRRGSAGAMAELAPDAPRGRRPGSPHVATLGRPGQLRRPGRSPVPGSENYGPELSIGR